MHIHAWRRHINYGLKISLLEKELVPSLSLTSPPQKTHAGPIYSLKTSLDCKWPREKRHQPSVSWLKNLCFEEQKLNTNAGFDAIAQTQWLISWALPSLPSTRSHQQSLQRSLSASWKGRCLWLNGYFVGLLISQMLLISQTLLTVRLQKNQETEIFLLLTWLQKGNSAGNSQMMP